MRGAALKQIVGPHGRGATADPNFFTNSGTYLRMPSIAITSTSSSELRRRGVQSAQLDDGAAGGVLRRAQAHRRIRKRLERHGVLVRDCALRVARNSGRSETRKVSSPTLVRHPGAPQAVEALRKHPLRNHVLSLRVDKRTPARAQAKRKGAPE
jgi:hypothetical protein